LKDEPVIRALSDRHITGGVSSPVPAKRRLTMFALTCVAFFTTCGGAFGIEPLVSAVGPGWALVMIVVTPLVWSIPIALMVAELSTRMPEEGGYYIWVRNTLGNFWAVQEAWWSMSYSIVLLAMFPVLFVGYLTFFIPALSPAADVLHPGFGAALRWLIAVLVTLSAMLVNLRGVREVGRSSKFCTFFVLGAFALLIATWLIGGGNKNVVDLVSHDLRSTHSGVLLVALSTLFFNYSGWDNISTYAAEVDQPQRNYPRAIAFALLIVLLAYVLPVVTGVSVTTDPAVWNTNAGWPVIAQLIGGRWLGALIATAGLVSTWALFNAQLLYVSRLPFVMAQDGWLPKIFANLSRKNAVPREAIISFCVLTAFLCSLTFVGLAVIQCLLYAGALTLEFLALLVLRFRREKTPGSFQVPGGLLGLAYVCVTPFAVILLVLNATLRDWRSFPGSLLLVALSVVTGVALFLLRRRTVVPSGSSTAPDRAARQPSRSFTSGEEA
jgi:amino acid transporter